MNGPSYPGGCLCGDVRYQATGEAANLCFCHCTSCRRAVGAPMVSWGTFARDNVSIAEGKLAEFHSSPGVTRGFCANCGTSLTYRHEARPAEIDVALATLDDATVLAPECHIWVGDKVPWLVISDGLPQYRAFRSDQGT